MFFTVIMYSAKAQLHFHSQVSSIFKGAVKIFSGPLQPYLGRVLAVSQ
jgi:hypothetical protein